MIELAKQTLEQGDCTLVVVNSGKAVKFYQRGVADLVNLNENEPNLLKGACIADKVVGKAAASLMIKGEISEVFSITMTHDAKAMFVNAGIKAEYDNLVDMVENRTKTGRCPLDTICSSLNSVDEMVEAISKFVHKNK